MPCYNSHLVTSCGLEQFYAQSVKLIREEIAVKPLLSLHPRDLSECPLNRGCLLNRGLF